MFNQVDPAIRRLRNLLYCGEWIESHVLHMFMLHLPDFLGYESVVTMAADHGPVVKQALRLKKLGNALVAFLGGRAVHPVGVCVGDFTGRRSWRRRRRCCRRSKLALEDMSGLVVFLAQKIKFPKLEQDYEFVALCPADEYPMNLGRIKSNKGLNIEQEEFGNVVEEKHVAHSTALHAVIKERGRYLVGPLARLNLNAERLHPRAAELLPRVCKAIGQRVAVEE